MHKQSIVYKTASGKEPYTKYVNSLKDWKAAAKISVRVTRAELGNLGDYEGVGHGVVELKINFGPGYRIYMGLQGQELIVLLCAGDKSSQKKDIQKAIDYWNDYRKTRRTL